MVNGLFNRRTIYNELDPFASEWLRRLCSAGHITPGEVIEGDITKLTGADISDAQRFHAFAGIGVWDYALRLAGWPTDVPVWTGSCPCQPFSVAGRKQGTKDERHLWPEWRRLIDECRPPVVFGEQVASPLGRAWFDTVSTDLEKLGYACGSADLCASSVGAPHIRQRLFFVAILGDGSAASAVSNTESNRRQDERQRTEAGYADRVDDLQREQRATKGFWEDAEWIVCRDGKARALEPGTCPVAHGSPEGMGELRAYGNAIVPQVAAAFIRATIMSVSGLYPDCTRSIQNTAEINSP